MTRRFNIRHAATMLVAAGVAASVAGCGRTLVFAERDGVNLAIRTGTSTTPLEVNFGLNRMVATIVPPAGEKNGKPDGDAVSMFAGFQIDHTFDPKNPLNPDLEIGTQFASGKAATAIADKPRVVAQIVNARVLTFATSDSAKQFRVWLMPDGMPSKNRYVEVDKWLKKRYPTKEIAPGDLYGDSDKDDYETIRKAVLQDTALMKTAAK